MASKKTKNRNSAGCLGLFGGIFLLSGLIPGGMGFFMLFNAWQASNWVSTPATLTAIELDQSQSDSGYTYSIEGAFRYEFNAANYTSDQLDFNVGSDNIGDYHQETYSRLRPQLNVRDGVTVYVNPDNPGEAVLIKDVRWAMVAFLMAFLAVFSGVGVLIMGMGIIGARKLKASNLLQKAHPEEPWRWEPEWEHGEIHCSGKVAMWTAVGMATFWNVISSFTWLFLPEALADGEYIALLVLIFPLVGVGLAVWAINAVRRWRRYGRTTLVLDDLPVRLGGALNGHLKISPVLNVQEISLTLSCVRITTSGSGKNRRTSENVLYQDEGKARVATASGYRKVALNFPIPADQPARDVSDNRRKIEWRLHANAKVAGPDLDVKFSLPVFEADMLNPLQNLGAIRSADDLQADNPVDRGGDPADTGAVLHYRGGGLRYYFPPARQAGMDVGFTVAGVIICAVAGLGWVSGDMWLLIAAPMGALGALFLWIGLNGLLWRSELRTQIGQLGVRTGWWLGRDKYYRTSDIKRFKLFANLRIGTTQYYQLSLRLRDGKKHVLAGGLKGKRNTEALVREIADSIGFKEPLKD